MQDEFPQFTIVPGGLKEPAEAEGSEELPIEEEPAAAGGPDLIIITGMSGAGRTEAMHTFEDAGYFCIDNLPPSLIMNLVSLAGAQTGSLRKLAIVCDLRAKEFFGTLMGELARVRECGLTYSLIFMDAGDKELLDRYKASRRRHPLCEAGMTISAGIARERELMSEVRESADYVFDTSYMRPQTTRAKLRELFETRGANAGLNVSVSSFGFKHGAPADADIVIDVRFLPNPFYVPELRAKTGLDAEVRDFVLEKDETRLFLTRWCDLLACVMPGYVEEGKHHLAIAVGCTGGQHRSVALAQATGEWLERAGFQVAVTHRDLPLAEVSD